MKSFRPLNPINLSITAVLVSILAGGAGLSFSAEPTNNDTNSGKRKGQVKERSVKRPDPRPKLPIPPKGPTDPQLPPIGPGGTGPTTPR